MDTKIADAIKVLEDAGIDSGLASKVARSFDNACHYCGIEVSLSVEQTHHTRKTKDHKTPIARLGGPSPRGNTVTCCRACNSAKGTMTEEEFIFFLRTGALHESFVLYLVEHTVNTQWAYLEPHARYHGEF